MAEPLILAIDLGTSFLKTVLFARSGRIVAADRRPYPVYRPAPGLVEQNPDDWIAMIAAALGDLRAGGIDRKQVDAIGLSGRGGGAVLLDENRAVLAPCWLDRRAARAATELAAVAGTDVERRTRGLASRIRYFRQASDGGRRLNYVLSVKDFVQFRLSDVLATDVSFAPRDGGWPRELWAIIGFPTENLPPILPLTTIAGPLTRQAAATLGLRAGIPVGVGAHDGVCANAGVGAVEHGQTCLTLGTHGVVRVTARPRSDGADDWPFESYSFVEGRRTYYCDLLRAGSAPSTVASLLAMPGAPDASPHLILTELASTVPPGSRGLAYLPFPSGQISPEFRPDARAGFVGMDLETTPAELYRSTLEGTACAFRSVVDHIEELGPPLADLRVSGGGATNPLWTQIIADVLERSLTLVEQQESARGAAMFAATGVGWFANVEAAAEAWVKPVARVVPSASVQTYRDVYARFRRIGEAVYAANRAP